MTAVLVVEDDTLIASSLARVLALARVRGVDGGTVREAMASTESGPPDLVLLDLGLPDGDGEAVCQAFARHHPQVPVIVVTARGEEVNIVDGLEMGAVDYVVKPFRLAELVARVQSHLRFAGTQAAVRAQTTADVDVVGDITIDHASRRAHVGSRELALRPKEFDVLARLARDGGIVVTREQLIDDVWDEHWWGSTKTLDVHINAVRRKLGEEPGGPSRIVTIRGVGYRLDAAAAG